MAFFDANSQQILYKNWCFYFSYEGFKHKDSCNLMPKRRATKAKTLQYFVL